ncbi:MAG: hypothetical protein ACK6D3_04065 [Planctomycetaceae bacterium]|jgi:hypothetical protein
MNGSKWWLRVGLPLAGVVLLWLGARSWVDAQDKPASDSKPSLAAEPARAVAVGGMHPWGDKLISVSQRGLNSTTFHLENVSITTVADRRFLVGTAVDDGGWSRKLQVQLAWDEVAAVVVYDSLEEFNERIREQQQQGVEGIEMLIPGFGQ